ncbi:hypothetical protein UFOVP190_50 [uncultured Caudovirales phage]|uniref:Uncharacterized protein n=1 Tax=uncultured Caudovirales phage TaxID=2100421 RepID=A0A6J7WGS8_9CAUD|nr:hypothetical protein UFOVP190_50 [uncultured Caudovirales phage]
MTYSTGSLILAADYNTFVGALGTTAPNTINTVWALGSGSAGYGQANISQVSVAGTVTATQWASLINTLNSIVTHQSGAGTGITAVTAGQTIVANTFISSNITTAYTNRLTFASNSAVVAGSGLASTWTSATVNATIARSFGARATFASADQARYFFNAGGRLKLNVSGAQSASTTARTNAAIALCTNLGGVALFAANTNGGRTGTGGTLNTNDTAKGYWTSTYNANTTVISVTSTTASYTSDTATIAVNPNGAQGSYNGNGLNVDFWINLSSTAGANAGSLSFNDSLGIAVTRSIDVSYPETTNLSNTWGAVTISSL